jgi:hypothetical protein
MGEHLTRAVIEPALISTVGGRLHHYALTGPWTGVPTFGPSHTEHRHLAPTAALLAATRARPMTPLPSLTHPSWKSRFGGESLTRMVLRLPDDLLLALALNGRWADRSAIVLAGEIDQAVKELRKSLSHLRTAAAHSLQPPMPAFEEAG